MVLVVPVMVVLVSGVGSAGDGGDGSVVMVSTPRLPLRSTSGGRCTLPPRAFQDLCSCTEKHSGISKKVHLGCHNALFAGYVKARFHQSRRGRVYARPGHTHDMA